MNLKAKTWQVYLLASLLPFFFLYNPGFASAFRFEAQTLSGLSKIPWIALPLVAVLGLSLNQSRIFLAALVLLRVFYLAESPTATPQGQAVLALTLAWSLFFIFLLKESSFWSLPTVLRLGGAFLPELVIRGLEAGNPEAYAAALSWQAFDDVLVKLPQAALFTAVLFCAFAWFKKDRRIRPFTTAMAYAIWPVLAVLESALWHQKADPQLHASLAAVYSLAFCGILSWAIFDMYWTRVYLDELTGVPNRRALDEKLERLEGGYALAMVDIDHFKKFNDTYGHDQGDHVLKLVARHLADGSGGRAYRYGGEEFCIVYEGTTSHDAEKASDGIRQAMADREFALRAPEAVRSKRGEEARGKASAAAKVKITLSMGVARPDDRKRYPHEVILLADEALYEAKEKGRNKVIRKN